MLTINLKAELNMSQIYTVSHEKLPFPKGNRLDIPSGVSFYDSLVQRNSNISQSSKREFSAESRNEKHAKEFSYFSTQKEKVSSYKSIFQKNELLSNFYSRESTLRASKNDEFQNSSYQHHNIEEEKAKEEKKSKAAMSTLKYSESVFLEREKKEQREQREPPSFLKTSNLAEKSENLKSTLQSRRKEASKKIKDKISNLGSPTPSQEQNSNDFFTISSKISTLEGKLLFLKQSIDSKKAKRSLSQQKEPDFEPKSHRVETFNHFPNKKTHKEENFLKSSRIREQKQDLKETLNEISNVQKAEPSRKWFFESYNSKENKKQPQDMLNKWAYLEKGKESEGTKKNEGIRSFIFQSKKTFEGTNVDFPSNQILHSKQNFYYTSKCISALQRREENKPLDYISNLFLEHLEASFSTFKLLPEQNPSIETHKRIFLPQRKFGKKTLIFDMDETLIHCVESLQGDFSVEVKLPGSSEPLRVNVKARPHLYSCLEELSKHFELIVFTASHSCYADAVINKLDPERKIFSHRLFREHCVQEGEDVYVKDIRLINRRIEDVILVDNSSISFGGNLQNAVPIIPFYDFKGDNELLELTEFLKRISNAKDVREAIEKELNFSGLMKIQSLNSETLKSIWKI